MYVLHSFDIGSIVGCHDSIIYDTVLSGLRGKVGRYGKHGGRGKRLGMLLTCRDYYLWVGSLIRLCHRQSSSQKAFKSLAKVSILEMVLT